MKGRILTALCAMAIGILPAFSQARPFDTPEGLFEIELIEYQHCLERSAEAPLEPQKPAGKDKPQMPAQKVHFAWGADLGASVDMSGQDMTTFDVAIQLGIRRGWLNFFGVGTQVNMAISNPTRIYPVFVLFRTNFTDRPTRCFWEIKGGINITPTDGEEHYRNGAYASTGLGINLAASTRFKSYLVLGYTFIEHPTNLHYASLKIGVTF